MTKKRKKTPPQKPYKFLQQNQNKIKKTPKKNFSCFWKKKNKWPYKKKGFLSWNTEFKKITENTEQQRQS